MAPRRPLPIGKASSHILAGAWYQSRVDGCFPLGVPVDYSRQTGNPADHGGLLFGKLTGFGIEYGTFDRLPVLIFKAGDVITHNLSISAF